MILSLIDCFLVVILMLNLIIVGVARLPTIIGVVAVHGAILGIVYPLSHYGEASGLQFLDVLRLVALAAAMLTIKGWVMPRMLLYAFKESQMRGSIEPYIGLTTSLLLGAAGTGLMIAFSSRLPLREDHISHLLIPASLSTVFTGFLILTTRREPLTQVVGYLVLENGIVIFGFLLVQAMPFLVELGVLLDVFVGVFVMGIILHHVGRQFSTASPDQLSALKE